MTRVCEENATYKRARKEPRREEEEGNRKNDECSSFPRLGNQEEESRSGRKALKKKGRKKKRKKEKKKNLDHPATLFLGKGCRRARMQPSCSKVLHDASVLPARTPGQRRPHKREAREVDERGTDGWGRRWRWRSRTTKRGRSVWVGCSAGLRGVYASSWRYT